MKKASEVLGVKIVGGLREALTPWAGVSLLVELSRRVGVDGVANKVLPAKGSAKGLSQGQTVESFVVLNALGGECVEDMERLRGDEGLGGILGYRPPAPETARQWLDRFHDESLLRGHALQGSFIPAESKPLAGLGEVNRQVVRAYVEATQPGWEVTLDVDAHLVETTKAGAQYCYGGYKAYQPIEVSWAESLLVLADEFRQGNVHPGKDISRLTDEAYQALPPGPWRVKVRSDSAAYQQEVLDHWDNLKWRFAVSADMSATLRREIEALPPEAWKVWKEETGGVTREWAEVPYVPTWKYEKKDRFPYRYLAIRLRPQQGELFADGARVRHFAVVTNIWDMEGQALLEWQRGKAGTIEQVHHILVNELGAGVFPSNKHGTNAAWLRLQVITHNLLQLLKKVALPQEYAHARPKRLRFAVFTMMGRLVSHAGHTLLRIAAEALACLVAPGRKRMRTMSWVPG
jgi:hypothetical protein